MGGFVHVWTGSLVTRTLCHHCQISPNTYKWFYRTSSVYWCSLNFWSGRLISFTSTKIVLLVQLSAVLFALRIIPLTDSFVTMLQPVLWQRRFLHLFSARKRGLQVGELEFWSRLWCWLTVSFWSHFTSMHTIFLYQGQCSFSAFVIHVGNRTKH